MSTNILEQLAALSLKQKQEIYKKWTGFSGGKESGILGELLLDVENRKPLLSDKLKMAMIEGAKVGDHSIADEYGNIVQNLFINAFGKAGFDQKKAFVLTLLRVDILHEEQIDALMRRNNLDTPASSLVVHSDSNSSIVKSVWNGIKWLFDKFFLVLGYMMVFGIVISIIGFVVKLLRS